MCTVWSSDGRYGSRGIMPGTGQPEVTRHVAIRMGTSTSNTPHSPTHLRPSTQGYTYLPCRNSLCRGMGYRTVKHRMDTASQRLSHAQPHYDTTAVLGLTLCGHEHLLRRQVGGPNHSTLVETLSTTMETSLPSPIRPRPSTTKIRSTQHAPSTDRTVL